MFSLRFSVEVGMTAGAVEEWVTERERTSLECSRRAGHAVGSEGLRVEERKRRDTSLLAVSASAVDQLLGPHTTRAYIRSLILSDICPEGR